MFNIKKKEAREFQRKGLPQEEMLEAALNRCQAAIIDQSKKSKACVEVVVFDLDEKSFEKLQNTVVKHEFWIKGAQRHNERTHVLTIGWGDE